MSWTSTVRDFIKDARVEVTKVSWPTRAELRDSTVVVIVTIIIVAAFVGVVDRILGVTVGLLFR